ncbi:hypothetical protein QBC32DRAFT_219052 [Pseudoneurospora amorphoporcata]|uniref:F-box domain-containing protein n=1 Tax=Pseudoneurospora amorphoporcata TaxID=241081 RepID=A0AAN6NPP4_9PEZI|nr:hypothetical protein QBC32DRAFT_219052 [Pseudoneurospora amorphoporcata]
MEGTPTNNHQSWPAPWHHILPSPSQQQQTDNAPHQADPHHHQTPRIHAEHTLDLDAYYTTESQSFDSDSVAGYMASQQRWHHPFSPLLSVLGRVNTDERDMAGKEEENLPQQSSPLVHLPLELVESVFDHLSAIDLVAVSATCRHLRTVANSEFRWQGLVQQNVPGYKVTSCYPYTSFRQLYKAHDPRWFLSKYKIWFADDSLCGRLIIARFDQRRGCIEAYQLVATVPNHLWDDDVLDNGTMIRKHDFRVGLHLDQPVIQLDPERQSPESDNPTVRLWQDLDFFRHKDDPTKPKPHFRVEVRAQAGSSISAGGSRNRSFHTNFFLAKAQRLRNAIHDAQDLMDAHDVRDLLHPDLSRSLSPRDYLIRTTIPGIGAGHGLRNAVPHGLMNTILRDKYWPPPTIEAPHRVANVGPVADNGGYKADATSKILQNPPATRADISDHAFHLRRWVEFGRLMRTHIGEELVTYSTLDAKLYTPTPEKPYRGIFVGHYGPHGCEFILMHQPDDDDAAEIERREDETDEEFRKRNQESKVYRGGLAGIKLTGDPNVPRGEYTFVAKDIGEEGFVKVAEEEEFLGARVVKAKGHVAEHNFRDDDWIDCDLFLASHNRLALHWHRWDMTSVFERVDIDKFIVPE